MKITLRPLAILALSLLAACTQAEEKQEGWVDLIDAEMTQWTNPYKHGKFVVTGDQVVELTADKKFFLTTKETFGDFVFEAEIKLPEGQANSGLMFRCHVEPGKVYGYQAECDGSDRRWSAGLYDEGRRLWLWPTKEGEQAESSQAFFKQAEIAGALKRNDWNLYRITCQGEHIVIELNGVKVTDLKDDVDASGHFGIQHHGEKGQTYRFRNIRVKELK
ncbi:MAG: 3-keto-disaccharide hydrolase [Verrucomicrobiales bacterium]